MNAPAISAMAATTRAAGEVIAEKAVPAALPTPLSRPGMFVKAWNAFDNVPSALFTCCAPEMTPPMIISNGPNAATKAKKPTIAVWMPGSSPVNQSTTFSSHWTSCLNAGSRFFITVMARDSNEPINCSTSFLRLSCMMAAVSSATPPQLSIEAASSSYSSCDRFRSDMRPERPVLPARIDA